MKRSDLIVWTMVADALITALEEIHHPGYGRDAGIDVPATLENVLAKVREHVVPRMTAEQRSHAHPWRRA